MVKQEPTSRHIILNSKAHRKGGEKPHEKPEEPEAQGALCASTKEEVLARF